MGSAAAIVAVRISYPFDRLSVSASIAASFHARRAVARLCDSFQRPRCIKGCCCGDCNSLSLWTSIPCCVTLKLGPSLYSLFAL